MIRKSERVTKYQAKVTRLKNQGYIEKVDPKELTTSGNMWYLPHFATQQAKFHVVYNGSTEFHGCSINQETLTGPDLLEPLLYVITRFRLGQYAIIADLKEFFFQIDISPKQRDLFHILWYVNDDLDREIETCYFTVHV